MQIPLKRRGKDTRSIGPWLPQTPRLGMKLSFLIGHPKCLLESSATPPLSGVACFLHPIFPHSVPSCSPDTLSAPTSSLS